MTAALAWLRSSSQWLWIAALATLGFVAHRARDHFRDKATRRDERRDITHEIREATHASEDRADTAERRVARELDDGPDSLSERANAHPFVSKPNLRTME